VGYFLARQSLKLAFGIAALSDGVGEEPMFAGVRRLLVTGLAQPEIETTPETVRIRAAGLTIELRGAKLRCEGEVVTVRLGN
jgi:hypothetical protein